jgi:hypothetical protein
VGERKGEVSHKVEEGNMKEKGFNDEGTKGEINNIIIIPHQQQRRSEKLF